MIRETDKIIITGLSKMIKISTAPLIKLRSSPNRDLYAQVPHHRNIIPNYVLCNLPSFLGSL